MRMTRVEKLLVNSAGHSRDVADRLAERIQQLSVRPGDRCLDVGCGNGTAAARLALTLGLDVTGVDVDAEQIRVAEQAVQGIERVSFRQANAVHLPFPDETFFVVTANKTTHHIPEWRRALAEMVRVMAPGGYLVYADLTVPRWAAPLLRTVVKHSACVLTRDDLDDWFGRLHLEALQARTSWHAYEAVFRRPKASAARSA